ncbi:unnamed protein product [Coccothraustes coccothraustes]
MNQTATVSHHVHCHSSRAVKVGRAAAGLSGRPASSRCGEVRRSSGRGEGRLRPRVPPGAARSGSGAFRASPAQSCPERAALGTELPVPPGALLRSAGTAKAQLQGGGVKSTCET